MANFNSLAKALASFPNSLTENQLAYPISSHQRLISAVNSLQKSPEKVGVGDLAGLVRSVLQRETIIEQTERVALKVPIGKLWPDKKTWNEYGLTATETGNSFILETEEWNVPWLGYEDPSINAFSEAKRRVESLSRADPFVVELTGYQHYICPGQERAVQIAFLMAGGHTLVVNLPTGSGKSLVFQAPALAAARERKLSVIVVPTTALAIDQERRFKELLKNTQDQSANYDLAYHHGLNDNVRKTYRDRIRNGQQSIVIASPEAVVGSLRASLYQSAKQGRLDWFVVDEAHLVSASGVEFRPEFQFLGGIRDKLSDLSPPKQKPRTLLLSATLTEDALDTLKSLFGNKNYQVCSAIHLRTEPDYWTSFADSLVEREHRVLEAIRYLPRPLLLYTSKPKDAEQWCRRLMAHGIRRVGLWHGGNLAAAAKMADLDAWNNRELDIMVATSAFGLGMDQADVRAVVHACVPETIDRYYQEVGRSGRDGKASVALLVFESGDLNLSKELSRNTVIGLEKGYDRWKVMWTNAEHPANVVDQEQEDVWTVSLSAQPTSVISDSNENIAWNRRTLLLMARARIISLTSSDFPELEIADDESEDQYDARWQREMQGYFNQSSFRVVDADAVNDKAIWDSKIYQVRQQTITADSLAHQRMLQALSQEMPLWRILADAYTLPSEYMEPVSPKGSCAVTRKNNMVRYDYQPPLPTGFPDIEDKRKGILAELTGLYIVHYSRANIKKHLFDKLLSALVHHGISEVAIPDELYNHRSLRKFKDLATKAFLIRKGLSDLEPSYFGKNQHILPTARVSILTQDRETIDRYLVDLERPLHIVVMPDDIADPYHPQRCCQDVRRGSDLEAFIERVEL
jgi:ATP-dependent DNA helicase RecQ